MNPHDLYEELLAAEALGFIENQDRALLKKHLSEGCEICPPLRGRFSAVTAALERLPVPMDSQSNVKAQLIRSIQSVPQGRPIRVFRLFWPAAPLAIAAALVLVYRPFVSKEGRPLAYVVHLHGSLNLQGQPVALSAHIPYNQTFITGPASFCDLRIADAVVFRVGPLTQAQLREHEGVIVVVLQSGSIFSHVKTGTAYAVTSPQVTAAALGTYFLVKTDSPQKTYVCICQGRLQLSSTHFQSPLASAHHQAVVVVQAAGGVTMTPDVLRDHLDPTGMGQP